MREATDPEMSVVGVQKNFSIKFSSPHSPSSIHFPLSVSLPSSPVLSSCFQHPPPLAVTDVISHGLQSNAINPTDIAESS